MPVARAVVLPVRVKAALAVANAVAVLPMPVPANFAALPAKVLVMSARAVLMTALPAKAHRVVSLPLALTLVHPVATLRLDVILHPVRTPVPRVPTLRRARISHPVPTSHPGSLPALPNLVMVAKYLCHVMPRSVLRAARVKKILRDPGSFDSGVYKIRS
jgi:hypothetical protein